MRAKERLYLTRDKKRVVKEGDPEADMLLIGKGQEVSPVVARVHGVESEKRLKTPKNKMRTEPENKEWLDAEEVEDG